MLPRQPPQPMRQRKTVPVCWLMCDVRLGDGIPAIVAAMPPRSAVVVRHYAMRPEGRGSLIRAIRRVARAKHHLLLLGGSGSAFGYDGRHGGGGSKPWRPNGGFLSLPVHDRCELARAKRFGADAVLISPVFATRSHPGGTTLGQRGFARLAATLPGKAVALGGMTAQRFKRLRAHGASGWAAIDAWQADQIQR